jgi:hypothetical protein
VVLFWLSFFWVDLISVVNISSSVILLATVLAILLRQIVWTHFSCARENLSRADNFEICPGEIAGTHFGLQIFRMAL